MPFDGKDFEIDVYTLRRRKLCEALRKPLVNWDWDFESIKNTRHPECGTAGCAMGYAETVFPEFRLPTHGEFTKTAAFFGICESQALTVFGCFEAENSSYGVDPEFITPAMVADKLEEVCGK